MLRASEPGGRAGGQGGADRSRADQGGAGKDGSAKGHGGGAGRSCPICGKPSDQATRPFCSKRCRDVDLNRWLSGAYVVPGREGDDEGSE
jgi:uncharacterized protein